MSVVVPFIGAAIGSYVGGTFLGVAAASWGWMAGSLLASAIFKPPAQQGPRLEDLTIVGTDYGQAIPWVAGAPRLAPQYAWVSPVREIANTQKVGKGGGQKVTTYTYECDVLLILTENVTEGVARDWINAELIRNGLTTKAGEWAGVTVYTGEDDQLPDPTYEAAVVDAPAYRGRTTVVISGLQLKNGKSLPNIEHQISHTVPFVDDRIRLLVNWPEANEEDQSTYHIGGPTASTGGVVSGGKFRQNHNTSASALRQYSDTSLNSMPGRTPLTYEIIVEGIAHTTNAQVGIGQFAPNGTSLDGAQLPVSISVSGAGSGRRLSFFPLGEGAGTFHPLFWSDSVDFFTYGRCHMAMTVYPDNTASIWVNGTRVRNRVSYNTTLTNPTALMLIGGDASVTQDAVYDHFGGRISRAEVYTGATFTPPTEITGNLVVGGATATPGTVLLNEALEGLMARAGYTDAEFEVDLDLQDKELHGYATANVTSTRAHLETLRPFGLFECNCSDKIYIFPRATEPVGVIPWKDLGVSETPGEPSDPFPLQMGNEVEVPAQIAVRYRNVAADWNTGTELSDRMLSSLVSTQTADMPFGLLPEQAKAIADTMLKDAIAGLGRAALRVGGRKHAKYEPGDVLTTTAPNGTAYRFRIINKRDHIFMLEWDVALDDASALDSPAITETGYISTEDPLRVAPTDWEVLALRPLRDSDATTPGAYVAVTPAKDADSDEWPGAVFVRSRLPGAFEQEFISGDACVIGECLTTLGDAQSSGVVQRDGKLRVKVRGELESVNYYDFFTDRTLNAAVVGNEPIRFMTATFIETDGMFKVYDLKNFLRGQLAMEDRMTGHGSGERFVLLNGAVRHMANETTDIGAEHEVKAVTLNLLLDEVAEEPFTDDGIMLLPASPVYPIAAPQAGGDIDVTWGRRSRLLARWTNSGVMCPVGETAEIYRIKVYDDPDAAPVRTATATTNAWTYEAADIASDGFSPGDPITIKVHQLSDTVGEGDAAILEAVAP